MARWLTEANWIYGAHKKPHRRKLGLPQPTSKVPNCDLATLRTGQKVARILHEDSSFFRRYAEHHRLTVASQSEKIPPFGGNRSTLLLVEHKTQRAQNVDHCNRVSMAALAGRTAYQNVVQVYNQAYRVYCSQVCYHGFEDPRPNPRRALQSEWQASEPKILAFECTGGFRST